VCHGIFQRNSIDAYFVFPCTLHAQRTSTTLMCSPEQYLARRTREIPQSTHFSTLTSAYISLVQISSPMDCYISVSIPAHMLLRITRNSNSSNNNNNINNNSKSTKLSTPGVAANCAGTQEFSSILWNPKIHHRVHKSPPLSSYPEPKQSNPYHPILSL
jgi:hypothetical protein